MIAPPPFATTPPHGLPVPLAVSIGLTAYDGAYIALAEALSAPLITRDRKLAAATGHHARIEIV